MKKFLPFSRRQPSLDRYTFTKNDWSTGSERFSSKSTRKISATSLNAKSIQVVRGAYNIDLNKVDSSFTKLHKACLMNDEQLVRKHLLKVDNNACDSSKRYPIHLATVNGNFAIVKLLIENRANPNVQDNEGNTPLIKSIECGHEHLVKYLLSNGADPNISDMDNNSALHWALITESTIAVEALLNSKKCDLTLRNSKDELPLHLAVRSPPINSSTYEFLLHGGSDLNATDQLGLTAYDIAQACHNVVAIKALEGYIKNLTSSKISFEHQLDQPILPAIAADDNQFDNGQRVQLFSDQDHQRPTKICQEYKQQYITKNQENLEYEKRLIQLNAQIERLRLDMVFLRERNEKLECDYEKLSSENSKLKRDNASLLEQINKNKFKSRTSPVDDGYIATDYNDNIHLIRTNKDIDLDNIDSIECKNHEEFIKTKTFLQDRINRLKYGLNM